MKDAALIVRVFAPSREHPAPNPENRFSLRALRLCVGSRRTRVHLSAFVLCVLCTNASAEPPRAEAVFTAREPVIDGRLGDTEWAEAKPVTFPSPGGSPGGPQSEVRFLWTADGVHVAFRATDATPAYGHFKPGEPLYQEDVFEMFIDQAGDQRQYYEIQASPSGQVFIKNYVLTAPPRLTPEGRLTPEFCVSEFWRWDWPPPEGFQIASRFDGKTGEWTMEMFLPASFVNRRRGGAPMTPCEWRLNLVRHDWDAPRDAADRKARFFYWAPILEGHPHMSPTRMGYLEFR
ncbi:MAG: carbohydrate-binding family 9-like protein [Terrimicrobiaceae bacterium]